MGLTRRKFLTRAAGAGVGLAAVWRISQSRAQQGFQVEHSDAQWRQLLTAEQYDILRHDGTEAPFTSPLLHETRAGLFACVGCDLDVFSSKTKYDSGTGWPSFWAPLPKSVGTTVDASFGMIRTAVHCNRCGGHLGHVFDDGPKPTGLRYCMNGVALSFKPASA
jgi:peptide-methionine (R)-S-oxide reductase